MMNRNRLAIAICLVRGGCLFPRRIAEGTVEQHGTSDGDEPISDASQGSILLMSRWRSAAYLRLLGGSLETVTLAQ